MTPEELVAYLAEMADLWERVAEEKRSAVVEIVAAALLLEPDFQRADLRRLLLRAMEQAGYPDVNVDDRLRIMRQVFPYAGLSARERALLTDTLEKRLEEAVARTETALMASLLNGGDEADQMTAIRTTLEKEVSRYTGHVSSIQTVLDRVALSGRPTDLYVYVGPADRRNRPFCGQIVRQKTLYTRKGVEALNLHPLLSPDVPPNVFTRCGGFKCRHIWLPAPPEDISILTGQGWEIEGER